MLGAIDKPKRHIHSGVVRRMATSHLTMESRCLISGGQNYVKHNENAGTRKGIHTEQHT